VSSLSAADAAWINAGWDEYARRMPRSSRSNRRAENERVIAAERRRRCSRPGAADRGAAGTRVIALDSTDNLDHACSPSTARWRDEARDAAFVIGSADGLADEVKRDAAAVVAISALTLPHGLVRIVVAEQLYRAVSLLAGHPYHRE
jgi:23S rRNA (pseudouridine1915-N3)-methyltransferase